MDFSREVVSTTESNDENAIRKFEGEEHQERRKTRRSTTTGENLLYSTIIPNVYVRYHTIRSIGRFNDNEVRSRVERISTN